MSTRSDGLRGKSKSRTTTPLGIEQLESRMLNAFGVIETNLNLLLGSNSQSGSIQALTTSSGPTISSTINLAGGTTVQARTVGASVLGSDPAGESTLKYTWRATSVPSGGAVSFAANATNAAKNNTLSFTRPGSYTVAVTIVNRSGQATTDSLQFNVTQVLTTLGVRTSDNRAVSPGASVATGGTSLRLTAIGFDQFKTEMSSQPTITWSTTASPAGANASLTTEGNSVVINFDRAGTYIFRAQSGGKTFDVAVKVNQTLTNIGLALPDTSSVGSNTPVQVAGTSQRLTISGTDQFGQTMSTLPTLKFTASSAPTSGRIGAIVSGANATLTFNKIGSYSLRASLGNASFNFSADVVQVLTSVGIRNAAGKTVGPNSTTNVGGTSQTYTAVGLDQFGSAMASQPSIAWSSVSVPTGLTPNVTTQGNTAAVNFSGSGAYALRAQTGSLTTNFTLNVLSQITTIRLYQLDNTELTSALQVTAANQRVLVRGYDQFGNLMATLPTLSWSTTSAPTGGGAAVTFSAGTATITFRKAGSYALRVKSGSATTDFSAEVAQTLTSIVSRSSANRTFLNNASTTTVDSSASLTAVGLDQFGQSMGNQPSITWSTVSAPSGGSATITASGNTANIVFDRAGTYAVQATSGSVIYNLSIAVQQKLTRITLTPGSASVNTGASQQFQASGQDQFSQSMTGSLAYVWSTTGGAITSTGMLTASSVAGNYSVTARFGTVSATATFSVVTPTTPDPPSPQNNLQDPNLVSLVSTLYADNSISRNEMMQILRSTGNDGSISSTELGDLQYIVSGTNYSMASYVRELARDVVNGNRANLNYRGQTAGNLAAGSSSTLLNNLVDKWFLGSDEPAITGSGISYRSSTGNLFNGNPSRNDALQGMLGDCYFITSLVSIADRNPDAVRNMFVDNGDGTYTVRFYAGALGQFISGGLISAGFVSGSGTADYVTVNRRLPTYSNGVLAYSGYGLSATSTATTLWIALAEKAYAQWNETGNSGRNGTNTYAAIEGGWMSDVNAQALGYNSTNYSFSSAPKQAMIDALTANRSVSLGTLSGASAGGLVGSHAYTVVSYSSSADKFTLHNPWGVSHPTALTWDQLRVNCSLFTIANPSGSTGFSAPIVRSQAAYTGIPSPTPQESRFGGLPLADHETSAVDEQDNNVFEVVPPAELSTPDVANEHLLAVNQASSVHSSDYLAPALVDLALFELEIESHVF